MDKVRAQFILRPERAAKIMALAGGLIRWAAKHRRWVRVKPLRSFCRMAVSTTLSVTTTRYHLRSLYTTLGGKKAGDVRLTHQDLCDLAWCVDLGNHSGLSRALWPGPPAHIVHTDALPLGWGVVHDGAFLARGFHSPRLRGTHINLLDLATVRLALESFRQFLTRRDAWLLIKSDSTVTVGALHALSSHSPWLMSTLRDLHNLCQAWGISIRAEHLRSAANA